MDAITDAISGLLSPLVNLYTVGFAVAVLGVYLAWYFTNWRR